MLNFLADLLFYYIDRHSLIMLIWPTNIILELNDTLTTKCLIPDNGIWTLLVVIWFYGWGCL